MATLTHCHDHAAMLDRMYRRTRHVYDLSRRYYLLGRDRMLDGMTIRPGDRVLEIGCGTARNLIRLADRHPEAWFHGLDACREMLDTAATKLQRAAVDHQVMLHQGFAEQLDHRDLGLDRPFDACFFSYCLSMVPPWQQAIDTALANLRPGGTLHVVDFYDQADLPRWFRAMLTRWLHTFHVHYRPELLPYLEHAAATRGAAFTLTPVARRYAFIASIKTSPSP